MSTNKPTLVSGRVPVTDYGNLTADRYEFLGLNQAEPNLGPGNANSVLTLGAGNTRAWSNSLILQSVSVSGNITGGNVLVGNILIPTTGNISAGNVHINNLADPVQAQDAATKLYVDTVAQGLDPKASVASASKLALPAYVYDNGVDGVGATITAQAPGVLNLDGIDVEVDQRVLIKNETGAYVDNVTMSAAFNGIYVVIDPGSVTESYVLIRAADFNQGTEIPSAYTFVETGDTQADTGWVCTANSPVVVGTTEIIWTQFSGAGTYTAGNGLSLLGTQFNVNVDPETTEININNQVAVKASANLVTPNIGNAVGNSLTLTGNISASGTISVSGTATLGNVDTVGIISATGNISGNNISAAGNVNASNFLTTGVVSANGNVTGGNFLTSGNVSASGTVTASSFVGNISGNIDAAGNITEVQFNDTGDVLGASAGFTFNKASNLLTVSGNIDSANLNTTGNIELTGGNITGASNISATGNATVGNVSAVNYTGTTVSVTGNVISGNVNTGIITATGNATLGNINTGGVISATGNITGANIFTNGIVSATGNATLGNIDTGGLISAAGNITGNYFIGNGSQLTGVVAANMDANLLTGNTLSSNVVNSSLTSVGNLTSLSVVGNTTTGNLDTAGYISATGNVTGGNLLFGSGIISGTGNIYADKIFANIVGNIDAAGNITEIQFNTTGDQLGANSNFTYDYTTNLMTVSGGNIQAGNLLSDTVSATSNVTVGNLLFGSGVVSGTGNIFGNVASLVTVSATGNITGGNIDTGGLISAAGNITGNYFFGNGSQLTGIITSVSNISNGTSNVDISSANANITMTVNGTANVVVIDVGGQVIDGYVATPRIITKDLVIPPNVNAILNGPVSLTGNVTVPPSSTFYITDPTYGNSSVAAYLAGSAGNIIPADDDTYILGNSTRQWSTLWVANVIASANVAAGNLTTIGIISATGNITGGNVNTGIITATGNATVGNINTGGLISATGNITGGNLLFGSGIISGTGNIYADKIFANIVGNVDAAGNITEIQFNTTGDQLGANSNFTYNYTTNLLTVNGGNIQTGNILSSTVSASGNITGGNVNTVGNVSATGNINGGNLNAISNINGGNVNTVGNVSATGDVFANNVVANRNVTATINLVAGNVLASGTISANGNITGNYFYGNGSQLTGVIAANMNANLLTGNTLSSNVVNSSLTSVGNLTSLSVVGNATTGNLNTAGRVSATGNVIGGNITTTGYMSAAGNVYADTFIGNISGNLSAPGANTQVVFNDNGIANATAGFTFNKTSNLLSIGGQIISTGTGNADTGGGQIYLNGSGNNRIDWNTNGTGAPTTTTRSDGTKLLLYPAISGSQVDYAIGIDSATLWSSLPVNSNSFAFKWFGATTQVASLDGTGAFSVTGNVTTSSDISATGNVTGNYFIGNGSQLTGVIAANMNANLLTGNTLSSNVVNSSLTSVGNLTLLSVVGNTTTGNLNTAGVVTATGNITGGNINTVGNVSANNVSGTTISATTTVSAGGNITGGNIASLGQISALGNVVGNNVLANLVSISTTANLTGSTGDITWNSTEATFDMYLENGIVLQAGQEQNFWVIASGNIADGDVVAFSGAANSAIIASTANAAAPGFNAEYVLGVATQSISNGNLGYVTTFGKVRNINTNAFNVGDILYLDPTTPGGFTTTVPLAPNPKVQVGAVLQKGIANGAIVVRPTIFPRLENLQDVDASSVSNADYLRFTTTGNVWQHSALQISDDTNPTLGGTLEGNNYNIANVSNISGGNIILSGAGYSNAAITASNQLATKAYVDTSTSTGLHIHEPVLVASLTNLNATYSNGGTSQTVDSITGNKTLTFTTSPALAVDDVITFTNSFNGITAGTAYFVYSSNGTNQITLSATYQGTEITTLTNGGPGLAEPSLANSGVGATLTNAGTQTTLTISNVAMTVGDRVLVVNQTNTYEDGVYAVSNIGSISTNWVMTRSGDADSYGPQDTQSLGGGDYFFVTNGNSAGQSYVCSNEGVIVFGVTPVSFTLFSASPTYTGVSPIVVNGQIISLANTTGTGDTVVLQASPVLTTPNIGAATGTSVSLTGNVTASNIVASGFASVTGNITGGNLQINGNINTAGYTGTTISVSGTVDTGNINGAGYISAVANVTGGNIKTGGLISATGNITGNYFFGNGSQLTGIDATSIQNGNSNVQVYANSNVATSISGISNVVVITAQGQLITGYNSATGNVTGGNILTSGSISATGNINIGNASAVTWANATGVRAYTYYNDATGSLDTVFI